MTTFCIAFYQSTLSASQFQLQQKKLCRVSFFLLLAESFPSLSDPSSRELSLYLLFQVDFPSGKVNRAQLCQLVKKVFPK
jgi:hypothetical protein